MYLTKGRVHYNNGYEYFFHRINQKLRFVSQ